MQTPVPRKSRFEEAVMNSRSSIHPPPDMLWQDLGIEKLIDQYNEENNAPPGSRQDSAIGASSASSVAASAAVSTTASSSEGTFGRFSRAVSSFFHGSGFSALGKRKAGQESASTPAPVDDRREQALLAYQEAKEKGLLPTPQVFVRPHAKARRRSAGVPTSPQATPSLPTPTPRTLNKSASKKDLHKQKKLSKRVSNLEHKLSEARKELGLALALKEQEKSAKQAIPASISPDRPLTPNNTHFLVESEEKTTTVVDSTPKSASKITKKRKATAEKAVSTYGDSDKEDQHEAKKKKIVTPRRASSRLVKKRSQQSLTTLTREEEVVMVVPDGFSVPPIPAIPKGVEGMRVTVKDDGFGGLSHEIF